MDLERPQNRLGYTHVEFYITGFVQTLQGLFFAVALYSGDK